MCGKSGRTGMVHPKRMKKVTLLALLGSLLLAACDTSPKPIVEPPPVPDVIRSYAVTDDALYSVVLKGAALDQKVMDLSWSSSITDAAQVGNVMYATTFSTLLKIDLTSKTITTVGSNGVGSLNALTTDAQGTLYASSTTGTIYTLNTSTGAATRVASLGYASSGDLAFAPDGTLYATVKVSGAATDGLARMKLTDSSATLLGVTGFVNVHGLDYLYGELYGRTNSGQVITINTATAAGTLVRDANLRFTQLP